VGEACVANGEEGCVQVIGRKAGSKEATRKTKT
jgi:hypothetical protein